MKVFIENQRFRQWWLILLFLFIFIMMTYELGLIYMGNKVVSVDEQIVLAISMLILLLSALFIFSSNLQTRIDEIGIHYKFWPIQRVKKSISWSNIKRCSVRKYSPIWEYGGWGLRGFIKLKVFGMGKNGMALNVSGNMGIQIEFIDGNKLLIGTQRPDQVSEVLKRYHNNLNQY